MATRSSYQPNRNRLSDRDMLMDLLATEKYMSHLYDHAIMKAASDTVRDAFAALQQDEHETAQMLFDFMQQHGWYTTGANRQKTGRRLQSSQPLSGGRLQRNTQGSIPMTQADSRYAVTSGSRRLGQSFGAGKNRSQGNAQPSWSRQSRQRSDETRPEWDY